MTTCGAQCSPATLNIWLVPFHFNMHITVTSCFILRIFTAALNAHWLIVSTLQMTTSFELSAAFNEQPAWQHYRPSSSCLHYVQCATTWSGANLFFSGMWRVCGNFGTLTWWLVAVLNKFHFIVHFIFAVLNVVHRNGCQLVFAGR